MPLQMKSRVVTRVRPPPAPCQQNDQEVNERSFVFSSHLKLRAVPSLQCRSYDGRHVCGRPRAELLDKQGHRLM